MKTTVIRSEGELEGVAVFSDFDDTVQALQNAFNGNNAFLVMEKPDAGRVAFFIPNITRIEEIES